LENIQKYVNSKSSYQTRLTNIKEEYWYVELTNTYIFVHLTHFDFRDWEFCILPTVLSRQQAHLWHNIKPKYLVF